MLSGARWLLLATAVSLAALQSLGDDIRLPDQERSLGGGQGGQGGRDGKSLLDWVGLGTGPDQDPYLARTNAACLNGELAECFKSQALGTFNEFFSKEAYQLTDHARVVRMPTTQLRSLYNEPYEFSTEPRSSDSEWDQLVKFALRKVEKFVKSAAFEVDIADEVTEEGRYSPRFLDEIADEIDVLEDKKAPLFSRKRLRKLFIPMLIILKLFKLKLLLFLPLILGLASFKKLLGFLAIIIPGLIGFFKLCKPNLGAGGFGAGFGQGGTYYSSGPQYSSAGVGVPSFLSQGNSGPGGLYSSHHSSGGHHGYYREEGPSFGGHDNRYEYGNAYGRDNSAAGVGPEKPSSGTVSFRDDNSAAETAQQLAYKGYPEYRNKKTEKS